MTAPDLLPPAGLAVGQAVEQWADPSSDDLPTDDLTTDARWFEYSRAANPIGSGRVSKVPLERLDPDRYLDVATGIVPFDLSDALAIDHGPATSPALLASFVRVAAGSSVATAPVATSELYYVLRGSGRSVVDPVGGHGEVGGDAAAASPERTSPASTITWGEGDVFVLPAGSTSRHEASADATLYWVTDEPLLRHLGVVPSTRRFRITHFPAERTRTELDRVISSPHATDRNRLAVLLNTAPNDASQTVTHVLWAMVGLLPIDAVQRPHRHQSVALDLVARCEPGCYTLVGRTIDDRGEIVDPVRVDWVEGGAFVTPPGLWHAHHNESGHDAAIVPIQDAGLQTYLRSLDIRFAPPAR